MPELVSQDRGHDPGAQPDPAAWVAALKQLHERLKAHFAWRDSWSWAGAYLVGLLSGAERKNSWQMAEEIGEANPYAFQYFLGRAKWDAEGVRDEGRSYVVDQLGEPDGVLVLDETGFVKKGTTSAGVKRQYTGTVGKTENCQVGVFLGYASAKGAALIDRDLYLPEDWAHDPERRKKAHVPENVDFATKSELGRRMIERAIETAVPFEWVTGDEVYGKSTELRLWLEEQGHPYVLAVASNQYVWGGIRQWTAKQVLGMLAPEAWQRLSAGEGSQGPRWYDWALMRINGAPQEGWHRWLLFRRSLSDGEISYYLVAGPATTPLEEMVKIAGTRWTIETCFELAKGEVGLDQYEVRSWHGWYRHITLSMLALAFLVVMRHQAMGAEKGGIRGKGAFRSRMTRFRRRRAREDRLLRLRRARVSSR